MTQSQTTTDSAAIQDVQLACSSASQSVPATPTRVTPSVAESTTATPSTTTVAETSTATPATVAESLTTVQVLSFLLLVFAVVLSSSWFVGVTIV